MLGIERCDWLRREERAGLQRRVGSLGFHNYNNFIVASETHFYCQIPTFLDVPLCYVRCNFHLEMKNVTFEELPGERSRVPPPPNGFTTSNRILSSWEKFLIVLFSSVLLV